MLPRTRQAPGLTGSTRSQALRPFATSTSGARSSMSHEQWAQLSVSPSVAQAPMSPKLANASPRCLGLPELARNTSRRSVQSAERLACKLKCVLSVPLHRPLCIAERRVALTRSAKASVTASSYTAIGLSTNADGWPPCALVLVGRVG